MITVLLSPETQFTTHRFFTVPDDNATEKKIHTKKPVGRLTNEWKTQGRRQPMRTRFFPLFFSPPPPQKASTFPIATTKKRESIELCDYFGQNHSQLLEAAVNS